MSGVCQTQKAHQCSSGCVRTAGPSGENTHENSCTSYPGGLVENSENRVSNEFLSADGSGASRLLKYIRWNCWCGPVCVTTSCLTAWAISVGLIVRSLLCEHGFVGSFDRLIVESL